MVNKMKGTEMTGRKDFKTIDDMFASLDKIRLDAKKNLKRNTFARKLVANLDAVQMQDLLPHIKSVSSNWYIEFKTDTVDSAEKLQRLIEEAVNHKMSSEGSEILHFDLDFGPEDSFVFVSGKKIPATFISWSLQTEYNGMNVIVVVSAKEIVKVSNSSLSKTSDSKLFDTVMFKTFVDIARDAGLSTEQAKKMFESMSAVFDVKMREDD